MRDGIEDTMGRLDEFNARSVHDDVLIDVADARMRDATLHDERNLAEREAEIVKGIELQRKRGVDLHAAVTDLADVGWLEDHYLAVQTSKELNTFGIPLAVRRHSFGIIA